MEGHQEWRHALIKTALELTWQHRSFPQFLHELCHLCRFVQDTSRAVQNLRREREQVDLSRQDYGQFTALQQRSPTFKQVLKAMDQTAGIDSPDIGIRVALKLKLYMDAVHAMPNTVVAAPKSSAMSQKSDTLNQREQLDILRDLNDLDWNVKVRHHVSSHSTLSSLSCSCV